MITIGGAVGVYLLLLNPINSRVQNFAFLVCLVVAWGGVAALVWSKRAVRVGWLMVPLVMALPFLLPGRPIDGSKLRRDYVLRMQAFEGTKYHWGGENGRGIDCSGLPRRALRDALLSYGLQNFNGHALRSFLAHWWFDASAKALAEAYRDYTFPLGVTGTIREMDYAELLPGDLAVTTDGVHILAYNGSDQCIQADPGIGSVKTLHGRNDDNVWFSNPVTTHRWSLLSQK